MHENQVTLAAQAEVLVPRRLPSAPCHEPAHCLRGEDDGPEGSASTGAVQRTVPSHQRPVQGAVDPAQDAGGPGQLPAVPTRHLRRHRQPRGAARRTQRRSGGPGARAVEDHPAAQARGVPPDQTVRSGRGLHGLRPTRSCSLTLQPHHHRHRQQQWRTPEVGEGDAGEEEAVGEGTAQGRGTREEEARRGGEEVPGSLRGRLQTLHGGVQEIRTTSYTTYASCPLATTVPSRSSASADSFHDLHQARK